MYNYSICIAGKNNIAVNILEYVMKLIPHNNIYVVCNKNENGRNGWQKSLRYYAHKYNIKEIDLQQAYEIEKLIFLSMEYDRIINPNKFIDAKLYNIHFSALPSYKGMYTSALPILNGEKYSGVTFHKIDMGIDTGDIIDQELFLIENKTCRELYFTYIEKGTELVIKNLQNVLMDNELSYKQSVENSTYYSKSAIDYNNIVIDLNKTAHEISNQIRAYNFREYQLPCVYGKKIRKTLCTNQHSNQKPGTIIFENIDGMLISTVDYNIFLYIDRFDEVMKLCKKNNLELIKTISDIGDYVNEKDENGCTPLMLASYYNYLEIVFFFLSKGGNIFERDNNEKSILDYAKYGYNKTGDKTLCELYYKLGLKH